MRKTRAHLRNLTVACLSIVSVGAHGAPAILIDAQSGQVFHHEQAFDRWSPASLTKLMTAYVTFNAIEEGALTLSAPVRMSVVAASAPPSKMGYAVGSVMTVENALEMLIIKSANDVAVALGQAVAGTPDAFVARMNDTARALGMTDTRFANGHGLDHPDQYSTARDLAILAQAIRQRFPQYDSLFEAEAIQTGETITTSYNLLLGRYAGADGMKTGFVCASGFNIAASATRDGQTMIAIVLGEESQKARAEKSAVLLETGFTADRTVSTANIQTLPRPENASTTTANLRPQVCTEEARAARWDGRQIEGFIDFETDLIRPLTREPQAIATGLGGAIGASASAIVLDRAVISAYPVPLPRPVLEPASDTIDMEQFRLRDGLTAPIPNRRPS
ncbi:MAG: D-alanyl-D-alanine carboxypeptidase family protein [Pseudomonadota bacterium]